MSKIVELYVAFVVTPDTDPTTIPTRTMLEELLSREYPKAHFAVDTRQPHYEIKIITVAPEVINQGFFGF